MCDKCYKPFKAQAYFKKGNEPEGKELLFSGVVKKCKCGKYYFKSNGLDNWVEVTKEKYDNIYRHR